MNYFISFKSSLPIQPLDKVWLYDQLVNGVKYFENLRGLISSYWSLSMGSVRLNSQMRQKHLFGEHEKQMGKKRV